jgi:hypothetical protein
VRLMTIYVYGRCYMKKARFSMRQGSSGNHLRIMYEQMKGARRKNKPHVGRCYMKQEALSVLVSALLVN